MATINIRRKSSSFISNDGGYSIVLEVLSTEAINRNVFIKERLRNFVQNNFQDVFVGIATTAYMEELDIGSPATGESFYRSDAIQLTARDPAYLEEVFESILRELQKLCDDTEALAVLKTDGIYTIQANKIIFNDNSLVHTHYRIPLVARPSGTALTTTVDGTDFQSVTNQNTALPGWLNTSLPTGYKFKYNIAADTTLSALWPPTSDFIGLAHVEVDGISMEAPGVLINSDGIFWKNNVKGFAPWAQDYVDINDQGTETITLVLDLVV